MWCSPLLGWLLITALDLVQPRYLPGWNRCLHHLSAHNAALD
jgi:hypothetical protein